ncbi:MAG: YbjN domain-containing protein [Caulobacteraceae bacterium]
MRTGIAGAAALALILCSGAAFARDLPAGGFTVADVVAWLQGAGYKAQVVTGSDGKTHVSSATDGVVFGVYMFDCKADRCGSMQFSAGFATHGKFDTSRMNEWNRDSRWARGYFDNVNDPWIEYDVDLTPGGTYELLDDEFATYRSSLARFIKLYGLQ